MIQEKVMSNESAPKAHFLLVDNERQMLSGLAEFFQEEGYRVDTSLNGRAAVECLKQES